MKSNKELREAYKQKKFPVGVFQIRNTANNKILVESSVNLDAIWNRHHVQLKFGGHPNEELQADWNRFGAEHFVFEILSVLKEEENPLKDPAKEVKQLEQLYIEELQPFGEKGYNRRKK